MASTTEILAGLLREAKGIKIDAEPIWCPKEDHFGDKDGSNGEAQAMIKVGSSLYCISLEKLP